MSIAIHLRGGILPIVQAVERDGQINPGLDQRKIFKELREKLALVEEEMARIKENYQAELSLANLSAWTRGAAAALTSRLVAQTLTSSSVATSIVPALSAIGVALLENHLTRQKLRKYYPPYGLAYSAKENLQEELKKEFSFNSSSF